MTLKIKTLMVGAAALALTACGEGPVGKFWFQPAGAFIDEGGFGNPTMNNMMAQMCAGQAKGYIVPEPVVAGQGDSSLLPRARRLAELGITAPVLGDDPARL